MFIHNKYKKWYDNIIENSKNRKIVGYSEKHHIIPKSLGGTNDLKNISILSAKEHFICHRLLTRFTQGLAKQKMCWALKNMLSSNSYHKRYNGKLYENERVLASSFISKTLKEKYQTTEHPSKGKSNTTKGRVWINKNREYKRVEKEKLDHFISLGWALGGAKQSDYGKTIASITHKNKIVSSETKKKQSEAAKKYFNSNEPSTKNTVCINNGISEKKVKREVLKNFLKDGWSLGRLKGNSGIGKSVKGKIWINDGCKNKRIYKEEFEKYILLGWIKGIYKNGVSDV